MIGEDSDQNNLSDLEFDQQDQDLFDDLFEGLDNPDLEVDDGNEGIVKKIIRKETAVRHH